MATTILIGNRGNFDKHENALKSGSPAHFYVITESYDACSMAYFVALFTCEVAAVVASTAFFFTFAAFAFAVLAVFFVLAVAVVALVFAAFAQHLAFAPLAFAVSETALQQVFASAVPALQHSFFTLVSTVCALAEVPKHTVAAISAAAITILFIVFTFLL